MLRLPAEEGSVSRRGLGAGVSRVGVGCGAGGWRRLSAAGRALVLGASVAGVCSLPSGCADGFPTTDGVAASGQLQLALSTSLDGVTYRLDATFAVSGPEALVIETRDDPTASVLSRELVAGDYVVALRPGFVVSRVGSSGPEPVEARLLSEVSQSVPIAANATTRVAYRFAVPGGELGFGTGELAIGFEVVNSGPDCRPPEGPAPALALEQVASGLSNPVFVTAAPGDDRRLFVVEKPGRIRVLLDGVLQAAPFLDLSAEVAAQGERGLLGLAFHPRYPENGLLYVNYTSNGARGALEVGTTVIARARVAAADPGQVDPGSITTLLTIAQPEANHNGGMLAFGADGYLYVGMGDGGGGNDQHGTVGNGQSLATLLGKLLRLDVDGGNATLPYAIPPGNLAEVTGLEALPEIWAYGLRNPWRFGFDPCNGDLYIGDVGQNTLEEIDYLPGGSAAGTNFGWRIMEGNVCRPGEGACNQTGLTLPLETYGRNVGSSVTGGSVYRGSRIPGLRGSYLYADFISQRSFRLRVESGSVSERADLTLELGAGGAIGGIASFGQDNTGELYIAAFDPGAVFRIVPAAEP